MTRTANLAAQLVRIDSVNPALIAGAAGEPEIAAFVAEWCRSAGLEVTIVEAAPGRPSVVARARGRGEGGSLMLNAHLDTVGVDAMERPFEPVFEDGRLYGRGSYDMKGALAAAMLATAEAASLELAGDVILAAVADEEVASLGTEAVLAELHGTVGAAIVCEPTELEVAVGHRGFSGFEIEVHGVAAHGSRPDLGVDAIAATGPILVGLAELDRRLQAGTRHPLLGSGSLHASLIEGGQEFSSYPERCLLTGERRTLPGETDEEVERDLRALIPAGTDAGVRLTVSREAFEIDPGHELVRAVLGAAGATDVVGLRFWADSALCSAAGIPTVLYGPAGEGAHAAVEWVDVASLERCREVYVEVARSICGDRLRPL